MRRGVVRLISGDYGSPRLIRIFALRRLLSGMRKVAFEPCVPTRGTQVPAGPWDEIKHDGYRLIIQREGKRVRLYTRNGHDWTAGIR